jgi:hypothetical protein
MEQQKIAKIKQELKATYKFIKYDGLILETFANNLLKLHSNDVNKTIEYLETLSKKDITDKFISIVKDFETSNEISEIIKSSIQIENEKVKVRQAKVNELDKETDDLLEYKEELEADLAKLKTEKEKITDDLLEYKEELEADLAKLKTEQEKITDDLLEYKEELEADLAKLKTEQEKTKDDFIQICQARETIFTDKIKQLEITKTTLQDTIDGVYRNELYEDEFNIPECKYILKEPVIHLNVDKIIEDLKANNCEISNINTNIITYESQNQFIGDHSKCHHCFANYSASSLQVCVHNAFTQDKLKINLNFPIDFKLNTDEFIVKIYVLNGNVFKNDIFNHINTPYKIPTIYSIIYITNFGRFIKSDDLILIPSIYNYRDYDKFEYIKILNTHIIYKNNKTNISTTASGLCGYRHPGQGYGYCPCPRASNILIMQIGGQSNLIILNELPTLIYRIPKLFLDVIDAFQQQNNDLMQQCCKRYLDITRETDRKKEILTTLQFNKTIKEKDDIIARKENIIKEHSVIIDYQNEELEKLKNENAKLKKALQSFLNE